VFKVLVLGGIQTNLDLLGPGGRYATEVLGRWLPLVLSGLLTLWAIVPLAIAALLLRKRGVS
jgi:hypothetical protein